MRISSHSEQYCMGLVTLSSIDESSVPRERLRMYVESELNKMRIFGQDEQIDLESSACQLERDKEGEGE